MSAVVDAKAGVFRLNSSHLELLKWVGLVAMVVDHVNLKFFADSLPGAFELGRLAFPLFAVALAFGFVRADRAQFIDVVCRVLLVAGATMPIGMLFFESAQLNILFTLALGLAAAGLSRFCAWYVAVAGFLFLGALSIFAEYSVIGFCLVFALVQWARDQSMSNLVAAVVSLFLLFVVNGNHWAVASVAVVLLVSLSPFHVPRIKRFFLVFYPAHLLLLLGVSAAWG